LGANLISPRERSKCSGITVFQISEKVEKNLSLLEQILDNDILISVRYTNNKGGLRVSTHYFNNEQDINNLISCLKKIQRK
jgi:cysteine desulfurase/selenocysteine lyase